MNTDTIPCPNCKTEIPLTAAVTHTIREDLQRQFAERQRQLQESLARREEKLAARALGDGLRPGSVARQQEAGGTENPERPCHRRAPDGAGGGLKKNSGMLNMNSALLTLSIV